MPLQILINILIGVLWMFLHDSWTALTFLTGYLFGLLVLFMIRRFSTSKFYLFTLFDVLRLFGIFLWGLFPASVTVLGKVLEPKLNIKPGIFSFKTDLEGDLEVTLLALLITLTPGTVVVEISPDNKIFYVHIMDIPKQSDSLLKSKDTFEDAIKRVTRS